MKRYWVLLLALAGCYVSSSEHAKTEARAYAKDMGYEVVGVSCTDVDTDGDGYVSCSLNVKDQPSPLNIECASSGPIGSLNSGCKVALPKLRTSIHTH